MKALMITALLALAATAPLNSQVRSGPQAATVEVQNDRQVAVTVYMEYGRFDRRLGTVPAMSMATLPLPEWVAERHQHIRLFVHPEGESDLESREFPLRPGERLALKVPARGERPAYTGGMMATLPPEELSETTLTVENHRGNEVTIYVEQGAFDLRLGTVPAHGTATLRLPAELVRPDESIQIIVHPEGGLDLETQTLRIRQGEHLGLRVPST